MGVGGGKKFGIIVEREREKKMNSNTLAKELKKMGYTLRKTDSVDARWMVKSDVLTYHWDFKDLNGVSRFMIDERALYRSAKENGAALRK